VQTCEAVAGGRVDVPLGFAYRVSGWLNVVCASCPCCQDTWQCDPSKTQINYVNLQRTISWLVCMLVFFNTLKLCSYIKHEWFYSTGKIFLTLFTHPHFVVVIFFSMEN